MVQICPMEFKETFSGELLRNLLFVIKGCSTFTFKKMSFLHLLLLSFEMVVGFGLW